MARSGRPIGPSVVHQRTIGQRVTSRPRSLDPEENFLNTGSIRSDPAIRFLFFICHAVTGEGPTGHSAEQFRNGGVVHGPRTGRSRNGATCSEMSPPRPPYSTGPSTTQKSSRSRAGATDSEENSLMRRRSQSKPYTGLRWPVLT